MSSGTSDHSGNGGGPKASRLEPITTSRAQLSLVELLPPSTRTARILKSSQSADVPFAYKLTLWSGGSPTVHLIEFDATDANVIFYPDLARGTARSITNMPGLTVSTFKEEDISDEVDSRIATEWSLRCDEKTTLDRVEATVRRALTSRGREHLLDDLGSAHRTTDVTGVCALMGLSELFQEGIVLSANEMCNVIADVNQRRTVTNDMQSTMKLALTTQTELNEPHRRDNLLTASVTYTKPENVFRGSINDKKSQDPRLSLDYLGTSHILSNGTDAVFRIARTTTPPVGMHTSIPTTRAYNLIDVALPISHAELEKITRQAAISQSVEMQNDLQKLGNPPPLVEEDTKETLESSRRRDQLHFIDKVVEGVVALASQRVDQSVLDKFQSECKRARVSMMVDMVAPPLSQQRQQQNIGGQTRAAARPNEVKMERQ